MKISDLLCGPRLYPFDHVLVGVRRDQDVGVTEALGHHADVDAGDQRERRPGVPQIMQTNFLGNAAKLGRRNRRSNVLEKASGW